VQLTVAISEDKLTPSASNCTTDKAKWGARQMFAKAMIESDRLMTFSRVSGDLILAVCFSARVVSREMMFVASATVEQNWVTIFNRR
jgi:hypothetical protein